MEASNDILDLDFKRPHLARKVLHIRIWLITSLILVMVTGFFQILIWNGVELRALAGLSIFISFIVCQVRAIKGARKFQNRYISFKRAWLYAFVVGMYFWIGFYYVSRLWVATLMLSADYFRQIVLSFPAGDMLLFYFILSLVPGLIVAAILNSVPTPKEKTEMLANGTYPKSF